MTLRERSGLQSGSLRELSLALIPPQDQLRHRYVASDLSLSDGADVSTWPDAAGTEDLTANTAPSYVASGVGGQPSVRFDDANSETMDHSNTPFSGADSRTMVFIVDYLGDNAGALGGVAGGSENDGHWWVFREETSDFSMNLFAYDFNAGFSFNQPETIMATYDGSTVETFSGEGGTGNTNSVGLNTNSNRLLIGARDRSSGADSYVNAQIAEILIWTKKLNSTERQQMFDYAKDTYGTH